MSFFQEVIARWSLPSPAFFIKVQKFGVSITALGLLLLSPMLPSELGIDFTFTMPAIVTKIATYMVVAGAFINRVAALAVVDPAKLEDPKPVVNPS